MSSNLDSIIFNSSSSEPTPQNGLIYFDDGTNTHSGTAKLRWYDGTRWNDTYSREIAIFKELNLSEPGSYSAGVATIRDLNTTSVSQSWASLSTNIVTVDGSTYPGLYHFEYCTSMYNVDRFYTFLVNGSGTTLSTGTSGYHGATIGNHSKGNYSVKLSTSLDVTVKVQASASDSQGLGKQYEFGADNCYTILVIERIF